MLEDWPFHVINDITERTYIQLIRECAYMFRFAGDEIGELSFIYDVPMKELGKAFWESRSGGFGFSMRDWKHSDQLHHVATHRFHFPMWVVEDEQGKLDITWNDPTGFDFT